MQRHTSCEVNMKKLWIPTILALGCFALFATTMGEVEKTCAVCGAKDKYTVLMSSNSMGSKDLDMRPPEMMRSTISLWVEKCSACGYCAADINKLLNNAKETISDSAYKAQLSNANFPELANKFLCRMLIEDKAGEHRAAIYSAICAGWASDDAKMASAALAARELSIRRILDLNAKTERYSAQKGADELLISDMYRRNGQFEKAGQIIEKGLSLELEDVVKTILKFELELVGKKDTTVHLISEAIKK
jgi:hypothetical protein